MTFGTFYCQYRIHLCLFLVVLVAQLLHNSIYFSKEKNISILILKKNNLRKFPRTFITFFFFTFLYLIQLLKVTVFVEPYRDVFHLWFRYPQIWLSISLHMYSCVAFSGWIMQMKCIYLYLFWKRDVACMFFLVMYISIFTILL